MDLFSRGGGYYDFTACVSICVVLLCPQCSVTVVAHQQGGFQEHAPASYERTLDI